METTLYDKIAFTLAQELGFKCYKQGEREFSFRKEGVGCGPPLHGRAAGPNPCGEVPLGWYELCLQFDGNMMILNGVIKFDLNDPESIDKFKTEFQDLRKLERKISNRRQGHPDEGYEGSDEPGILYKKHAKARLDHYNGQTWAQCSLIPPPKQGD